MFGMYAFFIAASLVIVLWLVSIIEEYRRIGAPARNIAQHQFMVVPIERDAPLLRTRNAGPCTVWYGWDAKRRVAFMAHFDTPWSGKSVPDIVAALCQHVPPGTHLETRFEGGLLPTALYSILTRRAIKKAAQGQQELTFDFPKHESFNRWVSRDVSLRPFTCEVFYTKLSGTKRPKGKFMWDFRPLEEVKPFAMEFAVKP